ncbi:Pvc16 family protein [Yinghuangia aomiensis]
MVGQSGSPSAQVPVLVVPRNDQPPGLGAAPGAGEPRVIHEVDDAPGRCCAPRRWTGRRCRWCSTRPRAIGRRRPNAPTVNLYLYDIREDMRRRERGLYNEYDEQGIVVARRRLSAVLQALVPADRVDPVDPEDEHRLLSELLACHAALRGAAQGADRRDARRTRRARTAVHRAAAARGPARSADVAERARRGNLPSLDVVVSVPVTASPVYAAAARREAACRCPWTASLRHRARPPAAPRRSLSTAAPTANAPAGP